MKKKTKGAYVIKIILTHKKKKIITIRVSYQFQLERWICKTINNKKLQLDNLF